MNLGHHREPSSVARTPARRPSLRAAPGPALALLGLALATQAACATNTLEDEWLVTLQQTANQPLTVMDYLPRPDTPGVPRRIEPYFFFNKALDLGDLDFAMEEVGSELTPDFLPTADADGLGLRYTPLEDIFPQTSLGLMVMDLDLGAEAVVSDSTFNMRLPEGRYFNAASELECTRFGGDPDHAKQLNRFMEPGVYPLYVMFVPGLSEATTFPATLDLYLGPGYVRDNGQLRVFRDIGFSTPMPGTEIAEDGTFRVSKSGAFLPLDSEEDVLLLYLERFEVSGRFSTNGGVPELEELSIAGVFPTRFLLILAASSSGYSVAVNTVELDVDLNANGVPDSATFAVRSHPTLLEPDEYSP